MSVTFNRASSKMKKYLIALVLIMSVSFANANNEDDKKKDSKIEKVESNKHLDMILVMSKKNTLLKASVNLAFNKIQICSNTNGFYIYSQGGQYYMTNDGGYTLNPDGTTSFDPPYPATPQTIDEVDSFCTASGGSWE
jgi:hypothetical protein